MSNNRDERYTSAGRSLGHARIRNRPTRKGGCDCPIIVEGRKDRLALESIGFTGKIEQVNRGWDQSRFVAFIFEKYGILNKVDQGPSVILLMDWDRTGGRLQRKIGERLEAFGMKVDHETRMELVRSMKPEGKTVEGLKSHAEILRPYIDQVDNAGLEEE
jgi:5S rRNA maturation endonuclease (ribonuclease M5)